MFQTVDGIECFVVDLLVEPQTLLPVTNDCGPDLAPYVEALNLAIQQGVIKDPGKYGINITNSGKHWNVFLISE